MRRIDLTQWRFAKSRRTVKEIVRLFHARGIRSWESTDVTRDIRLELQELPNLSELTAMTQVGHILRQLDQFGYATREISNPHALNQAHRTKKFSFDPDVDFTSFTFNGAVVTYGHGFDTMASKRTIERRRGYGMGMGNNDQAPLPFPPLPEEPKPYRLDEFTDLVPAWAEREPEKYARWMDTVIEWLKGKG